MLRHSHSPPLFFPGRLRLSLKRFCGAPLRLGVSVWVTGNAGLPCGIMLWGACVSLIVWFSDGAGQTGKVSD